MEKKFQNKTSPIFYDSQAKTVMQKMYQCPKYFNFITNLVSELVTFSL